MCFFRRIIYAQCAHAYPSDPTPARTCDVQRAYERGQAALPCGRVGAHSYASLRVGGRCRRCARADGALGWVRAELGRARLRLRLPEAEAGAGAVERRKKKTGGEEEEEEGKGEDGGGDEGEGGNEGMSPVKLTFSSVVLGVPVELRSSSVPRMGTAVVGDEARPAEGRV